MDIESIDADYGPSIGYLAKPKDGQTHPGVIMIHEWWGLNSYIKNMASSLASNGYNVLAVDLFNGRIAESPDEATKLVTSLDQEEAIRNLRSAKSFLRQHKSRKFASLGWCFGGGQSLQISLNDPMEATVIYYGRLVADIEKLSSLKAVLGIFGDEDKTIPVSDVDAFEDSLTKMKIAHEIYIYKGVGHAFANPSNPKHDKKKAEDAWKKTIDFLNRKTGDKR